MTQRMELGLMIAKTRPMLRPLDLHLRPISARFNQECHSPTKSCKGWWMWGGDACVALAGGEKALVGPGRGRRKRPHPAQPYPRPYGTKPLPRRCHTILNRL